MPKFLSRFTFILILILMQMSSLEAAHIIGGEITYECLGPGNLPNSRNYEFKMTVYRDCSRDGEPGVADFFDNPAIIGIHRRLPNGEYAFVDELRPFVDFEEQVIEEDPSPCIILPPNLCVRRAEYTWTVTNLPIIDQDYMISYQRCCRNNTIQNIINPGDAGAAFKAVLTPEGQESCNSSPVFNDFPPTVICGNFALEYDHSAQDPDGDQLVYRFCEIESAGDDGFGGCGTVPNPFFCTPPYEIIEFVEPTFNVDTPMAGDPVITVDSMTGLLSGTPNITGQFVVGVCVQEFRNGILIGETRRDFQFNVAFCEPVIDARIESAIQLDNLLVVTSCGSATVPINNVSIQEEFINEYEWFLEYPSGEIFMSDQEDLLLMLPEAGTYNGFLAVNPGTECSDTSDVRIVVTDSINADFDLLLDSCSQDPISFLDRSFTVGNTLETWAWNFGDGERDSGRIVEHSYSEPGIYTVDLTIIDSAGCRDVISQNLSYFPVPTDLEATFDTTQGCLPLRVQFRNISQPISSDYETFWDYGDGRTGTGSFSQHIYREAGTYFVEMTVISPNGCEDSVTFSQPIIVEAAPTPDFRVDYDSCSFGPIQFINTTPSIDNVRSFDWDFGDGSTSDDINPTHQYAEAGSYPLNLRIVSNAGCVAEITRNVEYFPLPANVSGNVDTFFGCPPFVVNFENTSEPLTDDYTVEWDLGNGETVEGELAQYTYQEDGEYDVVLTITSPIGCQDSLVFPALINVAPNPEADFTLSDEGCETVEIQVSDNSSSDVDIISREWNFGDGVVASGPEAMHQYISPGTYRIEYIIEDERRCIDTAIFDYSWFPSPQEILIESDLNRACIPFQVQLTNLSMPSDSSYIIAWDLGDGTLDTGQTVSHTYLESGFYDIQLTVISPQGCASQMTFPQYIEAGERPIASFDYSPDEPSKIDNIVQFTNTSSFADQYFWTFDSLETSFMENPTVEFPGADTFMINMIASSSFNCSDTTSVELIVIPAVNVYIPNVFSPNGDGINDVFVPFASCPVQDYQLRIFDRWGNMVFYTTDPTAGWDGLFKGENLDPSVYTWVIQYSLEDNKGLQTLSGDLTLVR